MSKTNRKLPNYMTGWDFTEKVNRVKTDKKHQICVVPDGFLPVGGLYVDVKTDGNKIFGNGYWKDEGPIGRSAKKFCRKTANRFMRKKAKELIKESVDEQ